MEANDTRDTAAIPSTESPPCRGRDALKGAQHDGRDEEPNNQQFRRPTHGLGALLWEAPANVTWGDLRQFIASLPEAAGYDDAVEFQRAVAGKIPPEEYPARFREWWANDAEQATLGEAER